MLTKLTITRGYIDPRIGVEEARPAPAFDYDREMAATVDSPQVVKADQAALQASNRALAQQKLYEKHRNNSLIASERAHGMSATAATPEEHLSAADAHSRAADVHDTAGQVGGREADHPHLDSAMDHSEWSAAHSWAADRSPGAKVHLGNYKQLAGHFWDRADVERYNEKHGIGQNEEPDEALAPETIGSGSGQRNLGPGERRMHKKAASHADRQRTRDMVTKAMDDPEAARDPGFDPKLPPKRYTGWAD